MDAIASQITSLRIVYSTVYSDADQRKDQSSASLAFVRGIHRWPVNSHKELKLVRDALEEESKIMVELFNSNSLQANPCKFQGILFKGAKKVNDFRIYVEDTVIKFQSEIDVLCVCIDDDMNFNSHVNNVCKKAGKQVSALQHLTSVLDQKSRMAIYQSFVMANFDYCPLVWFFTSRSSISKLEKIPGKGLAICIKRFCVMLWRTHI